MESESGQIMDRWESGKWKGAKVLREVVWLVVVAMETVVPVRNITAVGSENLESISTVHAASVGSKEQSFCCRCH